MSDIVYTTDSDEHKINTGEKQEPQWCEFTQEEIDQDIMAGWDFYDRLNS